MDSERWKRIEEIYSEACDRPPNEREAFARRACESEPDLLEEVLGLLARSADAEDFLEPPEPPPLPELEDFELEEEIGHGAIGVVYRAFQRSLRRRVAIKFLRTRLGLTLREIEEFRREPARAAGLKHPGIIQIHQVDEAEGVPFFVMDLVEGGSLEALLEEQRERGGLAAAKKQERFGTPGRSYGKRVAELVIGIAEALQYSHSKGIIHRDVKPANILLDGEGRPHLGDFGLARDLELERITARVAGTLYYMSPEQAQVASIDLDHRTDVYSLGVVLYELLTFHRPFEGDTHDKILENIVRAVPLNPRRRDGEIDRDLEQICLKAIAKPREERYATAGDFADDLHRYLRGEAPSANQALLRRLIWNRLRSQRRRIAVIAAATLLVLATVALKDWQDARVERSDVRERLTGYRRQSHQGARSSSDHLGALYRDALRLLEWEPTSALARDCLQRIEAEKSQVIQQSLMSIELELQESGDPFTRDEATILDAFRQLVELSRAFPEDADLRSTISAEMLWPTASLTALDAAGEPLEGTHRFHRVDPVRGEPELEASALGPLPATDVRVPPGYYRVVLSVPGFPARELTRVVKRGPPVDVTASFPAGQRRLPDQIRIAGGTIDPLAERSPLCPHREAAIEIAPFWIDRYEVSMGEFRDFLAATGRRPPIVWEMLDGLPTVPDELPAVLVPYADAQACAEWFGMRLPTHGEFELASRGVEGRLYPWGFDLGGGDGNIHHPSLPAEQRFDLIAEILERAAPVTAFPESATPLGVQNLFGNVAEWTETLLIQDLASGQIDLAERYVLGHDWTAMAADRTLVHHVAAGIEPSRASTMIGFRCVRSIDR